MIILIKIFSLFLGATVISKTYLDFKKKQESLTMFLFWAITWLFIMYAAVESKRIYSIMQNFSKENIGIGTFGGIAFVFLFFITYRIYVKANRLEKLIHDIIVKLALKNIDED